MGTSTNELLFSHGAIQASPDQVVRLNQNPPTEFFDRTVENAPSTSGYQVILTGYSTFVLEKEANTNEYRFLSTALMQMRSNPRPMSGHQLKGSVTTFSNQNDYYRIDYRINSGQVEVFNIQPTDKVQLARDKRERIAVYKIKKNTANTWTVDKKLEGREVETKYAAVNGQSNNLVKATWLMGKHLERAYGEGLNEYTLFHNPSVGGMGDTWESIQDKLGFTTDVTKQFANCLEKAQEKQEPTYWVAHSQGGLIFSEGVRYLLNKKSSSLFNALSFNGLRNKDRGSLLDKQKVTFHGNANNNFRSKKLLERAGVEVVAIRGHDYDFVTNIIGMNTISPRKLTGSLVYANHVFNGSLQQSPHTTIQSHESWEKHMENGPGLGRNRVQKGFFKVEKKGQAVVKLVKNYLK